jgi:hypothetical protein
VKARAIAVMAAFLMTITSLGVALVASPAQAHSGTPPAACVYYESSFGASCFEWEGDDQWVADLASNGWSARAQIETNYGKTRWCANTHTAPSWHECTFDHDEDGCVRWRMYEQDGGDTGPTRNWTNWTAWHSIRTGDAC